MNQHMPRSRVSEQIDANLKRAFDEISNEAVPDRFSDLLAKLRESEKAQSSKETQSDS